MQLRQAGDFFLTMRNNPKLNEELDEFIANGGHRWDEPLPQPAERAVAAFISCLLRHLDAAVGKTHGIGPLSGMAIDAEKAARFKKSRPTGQKGKEK